MLQPTIGIQAQFFALVFHIDTKDRRVFIAEHNQTSAKKEEIVIWFLWI